MASADRIGVVQRPASNSLLDEGGGGAAVGDLAEVEVGGGVEGGGAAAEEGAGGAELFAGIGGDVERAGGWQGEAADLHGGELAAAEVEVRSARDRDVVADVDVVVSESAGHVFCGEKRGRRNVRLGDARPLPAQAGLRAAGALEELEAHIVQADIEKGGGSGFGVAFAAVVVVDLDAVNEDAGGIIGVGEERIRSGGGHV